MLGTVDGDAVNDAGDVQDTVDVCLVLLSVIVAVPWVDPVVREKVADVLLETDMLEMLLSAQIQRTACLLSLETTRCSCQ